MEKLYFPLFLFAFLMTGLSFANGNDRQDALLQSSMGQSIAAEDAAGKMEETDERIKELEEELQQEYAKDKPDSSRISEIRDELMGSEEDEEGGLYEQLQKFTGEFEQNSKASTENFQRAADLKRAESLSQQMDTKVENLQNARSAENAALERIADRAEEAAGRSFEPSERISETGQPWDDALKKANENGALRPLQDELLEAGEQVGSAQSQLTDLKADVDTIKDSIQQSATENLSSAVDNFKNFNFKEGVSDLVDAANDLTDMSQFAQQSDRASEVLAGNPDPLANNSGISNNGSFNTQDPPPGGNNFGTPNPAGTGSQMETAPIAEGPNSPVNGSGGPNNTEAVVQRTPEVQPIQPGLVSGENGQASAIRAEDGTEISFHGKAINGDPAGGEIHYFSNDGGKTGYRLEVETGKVWQFDGNNLGLVGQNGSAAIGAIGDNGALTVNQRNAGISSSFQGMLPPPPQGLENGYTGGSFSRVSQPATANAAGNYLKFTDANNNGYIYNNQNGWTAMTADSPLANASEIPLQTAYTNAQGQVRRSETVTPSAPISQQSFQSTCHNGSCLMNANSGALQLFRWRGRRFKNR